MKILGWTVKDLKSELVEGTFSKNLGTKLNLQAEANREAVENDLRYLGVGHNPSILLLRSIQCYLRIFWDQRNDSIVKEIQVRLVVRPNMQWCLMRGNILQGMMFHAPIPGDLL